MGIGRRAVVNTQTLDQIIAIDLLTLKDLRTGAPLDPDRHRIALAAGLSDTTYLTVKRDGDVSAYASLREQADGAWFILGLGIHPDHHNAGTTRKLLKELTGFLVRNNVKTVHSNVRHDNTRSMRLHKRLGFDVLRENEIGVAFSAPTDRILRELRQITLD